MPRSTKSRGVRKDAAANGGQELPVAEFDGQPVAKEIVDEVQNPQVEQALENYAEAHRQADLSGDAADTAEEEPLTSGLPDTTDVERIWGEEPEPQATQALHARDFDWDTMRWVPPKTTGTRPCLCNRLRGHECDLSTKSRFAIGHDARFKGILQTAYRGGAQLPWTFETGDTLTTAEGTSTKLDEPEERMLAADQIARMVAPKLLPHVTHESRGARLQALDAAAGTTVPQTAVDHPKADEDLTDADLADVVDDAEGVDAQFVES
jgi:hypothetical protein